MTQSEELITTSIRLTSSTMATLDEQSSLLQTTRSGLIRDCISKMLAHWQEEERDQAIESFIAKWK